jgi:hypothetical protein
LNDLELVFCGRLLVWQATKVSVVVEKMKPEICTSVDNPGAKNATSSRA